MDQPSHPVEEDPIDKRIAAILLSGALLAAGCSSPDTRPELTTTEGPATTFAEAATTTTTTTSTTLPNETVEDFFEATVGAAQTGNPVFLIQRIHPEVRDYYGRQTCRDYFDGYVPDDTANYSIKSISEPTSWSEVFDGTLFSFEDIITVDVEFVDFGFTRRQDMRLQNIDDRFYYFLDCGEPEYVALAEPDAELLDPDGDGYYIVHRAPSDSEDFWVPSNFRVTYTGSSSTCGLAIHDAETGQEVIYVTGLDGGGFKRIVLEEAASEVYLSDLFGCAGGEILVGPNP